LLKPSPIQEQNVIEQPLKNLSHTIYTGGKMRFLIYGAGALGQAIGCMLASLVKFKEQQNC
jgi:hypothetical protein